MLHVQFYGTPLKKIGSVINLFMDIDPRTVFYATKNDVYNFMTCHRTEHCFAHFTIHYLIKLLYYIQ